MKCIIGTANGYFFSSMSLSTASGVSRSVATAAVARRPVQARLFQNFMMRVESL